MKVLVYVLLAFMLLTAGAAFGGWVFMLFCGAVWSEFHWLAPVSYLPATGIFLAVSVMTTLFSGVQQKSRSPT